MARKYSKISENAFKEFVFDAGMVLSTFDPTGTTEMKNDDIVCDTTGDITATCVPTYVDMGEDVNNCPNGMKELMEIESWETRLAFTALNCTTAVIALALGAADIADTKVTPRMTLNIDSDFKDIWLVLNVLGGGMAAVHLKNALSSAGLSLTTTKKGKGQLQVELQGHPSIDAQDDVPMEFYYSPAE